ncbi:putative bifunctional diguanylate cyclase/phosphodiesterase [Deinococcus geothermalis]|uniref:putative bifunctional diguanylate cyclase/phosphodiesterase n=1 Tax=Deinococcus geothermalis TaxID=68909 RepID=UPI00235211D0|nr:EAL domain-containing protein [Deinococcus geothermalis]
MPPITPAIPLRFSLRLKVLAALGLAGLFLMLLLSALLPRLIVARFDRQETGRMREETQRARRALASELANLSTYVLNWTVWDETYRYVQHPTRDYERSNLTAPTFQSARVNLFLYFDRRRELISAWNYDLEHQRFVSAAPVAAQILPASAVLLQLPGLQAVRAGLLMLSDGPWLLAARPVLTGAGTGPIAGSMVIGKRLTPAVLNELKRDPRLSLQLQAVRPTDGTEEISVRPLSEWQLEGQTRLLDLYGQPSLLLRVTAAREDHINGVVAAQVILITVLALVLLFTALTMLLVERLVLRRLAVYRHHVQALQGEDRPSDRFPVRGQDELSALGEALNHLLDRTEQHQQQLVQQASQDELTGLPNRRFFQQRLAALLRVGQPFAVVLLDLNDFKTINDTLGHEVGDEVLRAVAERFLRALRPEAQELVARLGGDEFVLLLPDTPQAGPAAERTAAILSVLQIPLPTSAGELFVSASAGLSRWPDEQEQGGASALLKQADLAMYRAKASGTPLELYTPVLSEEARQRSVIERDLRGALDRGEFTLVYQPVVDLHSGKTVGCEALLRWHHPELGAISPQCFIPVAEESGLIGELGLWVLRTACTQAGRWRAAGQSLRVAVNLSAMQLRGGAFASQVARILADCGLPPELLELEVTETAVMDDLPNAIRQLTQIRALGVTVALDDFGTGYASLELVRELPLDKLKLDRSFLSGAEADRRRQVIIASVIRMAGELGWQIVAEGVETPEQVDLLLTWHCSLAQGYLYARPMRPDEFWTFLHDSARSPSS